MADLSQNSFIPKRGPAKRKRRNTSRQVYIFTMVSYVLVGSSLLASAGVFFFKGYVENQRDDEIAALNQEISNFRETDMQRVLAFEQRLEQAYARLDNSVSVASLFDAIESATVDTISLVTFNLDRQADSSLEVKAMVETDSFDSTLFQRGVYQRNPIVQNITFTEVIPNSDANEEEDTTVFVANEEEAAFIVFNANISVPLDSVPYVPPLQQVELPPVSASQTADPFSEFNDADGDEILEDQSSFIEANTSVNFEDNSTTP